MARIKLFGGQYALVDARDFGKVSAFKWYLNEGGYAIRNAPNGRHKRMHRFILDLKPEEICDHINGNKLDNRRSNLRICTTSENMQNKPKQLNNTSGFKGVSFHKETGKWRVRIKAKGVYLSKGLFNTPEEAAEVYNLNARLLHGQFARYE